MFYKKIQSVLSESELEVIDNKILSNNFSWFYQETSIPKNKKYHSFSYPFLCHNLMLRANSKNREPGIVNSEYFNLFHTIFKRHCPEHEFLLRMSLNLTFHHDREHGDIHVDHHFEHNNFIVYLNSFTNGSTFLFDDKHNKVGEIPSERNTGCIFPGSLHAQGFCNMGETRLILIATYV